MVGGSAGHVNMSILERSSILLLWLKIDLWIHHSAGEGVDFGGFWWDGQDYPATC